ncbi:hypothetical protein BU26DRAFT_40416 [Trematosphaeria pertusa]|uniref:Uncharacterized protein n=1 Tax=Trematosphaeria pertusa TaxID=390896 RepID=A0A6A6J361_9PLEO|nr:uncharacterized protein BU26DRAFT_40416 [Trematosphaeria pertusa]KAF2257284.1 hypothetical protein BU26DRAFT_40416 [Trematosphaeria pertusa]
MSKDRSTSRLWQSRPNTLHPTCPPRLNYLTKPLLILIMDSKSIKAQLTCTLLRQPSEIRLSIYDHLTLPPFDGYEEYAGFFACCRQIKDEVEREAAVRLTAYLAEIEQEAIAKYEDRWKGEPLTEPITLTAINTFENLEVILTVPFLLPSPGIDWHRTYYFYGCVIYPGSVSAKQSAHEQQQDIHHNRVQDMLDLLEPLYSLHLSGITVRIEADDASLARIRNDDELLNKKFPNMSVWSQNTEEGIYRTPFGRLIHPYATKIDSQTLHMLFKYLDDGVPINTTKIAVQWDFAETPPTSANSRKYEHESSNVNRGRSTTSMFAADRLTGVVLTELEVEQFLWNEKKQGERLSTMINSRGSGGREQARTRDSFLRKLEKANKRLQEMGVLEDEDADGVAKRTNFDYRLVDGEWREIVRGDSSAA